jgi:hypothetical protein
LAATERPAADSEARSPPSTGKATEALAREDELSSQISGEM